MSNVRPLEDRIVVKPLDAETKTASGIFLPESAKEKPMKEKSSPSGQASCWKTARDSRQLFPRATQLSMENTRELKSKSRT